MGWSAARDWTAGEIVLASHMNTHVRDNLKYLKGQGGRVSIDDQMEISVGAGVTAGIYLKVAAAEKAFLNATAAGVGLWNVVNSEHIFYWTFADKRLLLGTDQLVAHRHPYANQRHIESGDQLCSAAGNVTVTFTNAFKVGTSPSVTCTPHGASIGATPQMGTPTATTFTISVYSGGSREASYVRWIAEGED